MDDNLLEFELFTHLDSLQWESVIVVNEHRYSLTYFNYQLLVKNNRVDESGMSSSKHLFVNRTKVIAEDICSRVTYILKVYNMQLRQPGKVG